MKFGTTISLLLCGALIFGSGQYVWGVRYQIPLPERTYSGGWRFSLEAVSQNGQPNVVQVMGYDTHGDLVLTGEPEELWLGQVFRYVLTGQNPNRVQSLVLLAEMPVHGFLWIENESTGQINGVSLEKAVSSALILPHIPRNYFKWKVSFASMGVDSGIGSADVSFAYFNDFESIRYDEPVEEDFENHAYLRRTPNHDFLTVGLGTESAAAWGLLRTSTDHFQLTGYQTFARLDESVQTCSMTMLDGGSDTGVVVFSPEDSLTYDDYFIFVNPLDEAVNIDFSLVQLAEEDGLPRVETIAQSITLGANQKRIDILGMNLFPDFEGVPRTLRYSARLAFQESVIPAQIQAIHLQSELQDQALGGHWFSTVGNQIQTWMTIGPNRRSVLELANMSEEPTTVVVTLSKIDESRFTTIDLGRGEVATFDDVDAVGFFGETTETMAGRTIVLNVRTSVILDEEARERGTIAGKFVVFSGQDLAIVNPIVGPFSD